jgi:hypothetical protein
MRKKKQIEKQRNKIKCAAQESNPDTQYATEKVPLSQQCYYNLPLLF